MHPPAGPAASPGPAAPPAGAELLRWQWQEVQVPCLVAAWILVASLAKIGECRPRGPEPRSPAARRGRRLRGSRGERGWPRGAAGRGGDARRPAVARGTVVARGGCDDGGQQRGATGQEVRCGSEAAGGAGSEATSPAPGWVWRCGVTPELRGLGGH